MRLISTYFGLGLWWLLYLYSLILLARVVLDWVQLFARHWEPRGVLLVIANVIYRLTDPPLRFLRRFIPPLQFGMVAIDVGFVVLFIGISMAMWLVQLIFFF